MRYLLCKNHVCCEVVKIYILLSKVRPYCISWTSVFSPTPNHTVIGTCPKYNFLSNMIKFDDTCHYCIDVGR